MEKAIRFSQNSLPGNPQRFLYVDVRGKSFRLCNITSQRESVLTYETVQSSTKIPAFRAFDWHPSHEDLIVVGQSGGEATLLNIAEGKQDSLSFPIRNQRSCNAVSLNSQDLLAVGLDRIRTDFCLNIWDFNQRLPTPGSEGFSKNDSDPLHRLANGEPITSLKFFQGEPSLLVAGVKGQFVRLYDLREPSVGNGLQFATRCVHNIAIDWLDENYLASCYSASEPTICVWDRRMITRVNTPHMSFPPSENRQPEVSLELKNAVQSLGVIWSLRFSKAQRGCLGALSEKGHLKVYNLGKDFSEDYKVEQNEPHDQSWESRSPQELYLDRTQDIAKHVDAPTTQDEVSRIISFDFLTSTTKYGESQILVLNARGNVELASPRPKPQAMTLSSVGYLSRGTSSFERSSTEHSDAGALIDQARRRAQPRNTLKKSFEQTRQNRTVADAKRMSSLDDQAWHADLGFYETDVPLPDLLTLTSVQRLRCTAGYLLNPSQNKAIVSDSNWLQSFWAWIERAARISRNGNMAQDNVDLAYIGIYGIWMEDLDLKNRTLGPTSNRLKKTVENLVRRLNIPGLSDTDTQYPANRLLCLHSAGLAWSSDDLEVMIKRLVAKNQHTKAAALALFVTNRKLAYKALRNKTANQSHKMLAMAIAGAFRRMTTGDSGNIIGDESGNEDDWAATIASLADELTDPYARAILAYVRTSDWSNVVAEESLPLKYRIYIALRHYDDSKLTHYIAQATRHAVGVGDIEGIILTGTATQASFDLMTSYLQRFGDLQTTVLALCPTVPRYLDDEKILRKFTAWKDTYRDMMNSWNLKFHRVRFDIASQNAAKDGAGRALIPAAKQQVRLVCQYCSQGIAHGAGTNKYTSPGHKTVDTPRHPLSKEKAAAIGTVCPKCERHLPRCAVCDMWLGVPDDSYMPWYGAPKSPKSEARKGSLDLSASVAGSIQTTLGPEATARTTSKRGSGSPLPRSSPQTQPKSSATDSSTRTAVPLLSAASKGVDAVPEIVLEPSSSLSLEPDTEQQRAKAAQKWDTAMSRFTVLCVKCSHGCHAAHARMWFEKHRVCPVPECRCLCNE